MRAAKSLDIPTVFGKWSKNSIIVANDLGYFVLSVIAFMKLKNVLKSTPVTLMSSLGLLISIVASVPSILSRFVLSSGCMDSFNWIPESLQVLKK